MNDHTITLTRQVVAIAMILVPMSFLQVRESSRCPLGFCDMFLRGPTWELEGYLLGLMDLDLVSTDRNCDVLPIEYDL